MRGAEVFFGENILQGGRARGPKFSSQPRWSILLAFLVVFFLVGFSRLADLQIIRGAYFKGLARENRIRRIPIKAPRGEILDRNGKPLARNKPIYKLAEFSSGGVVVRTRQIPREEALKVQEETKEANLLIEARREYPLGEAGAHVVGYVSEANEKEVGRRIECPLAPENSYQLGDLVGRMGIEAQYDCLLRGVNGEELIEVDTKGILVRKLGRREPIPGKTIQLSVDGDLQQKAYEALTKDRPARQRFAAGDAGGDGDGKLDVVGIKGALIAQDYENGEVLALVSAPSFNPERIGENYQILVNDSNKPFFNRVISAAYPPGSTFKIVSSAAALEERKIDRDYRYIDPGAIRVGDFSYSNWFFSEYGKTEGEIDLVSAIARSTDTFFYKIGELTGPDKLAGWARKFGLGEKTGIDLPGEIEGVVPDPAWKERVRGERWFLGNTYHMSIGQGDLIATPLQINQMTDVIASGGRLCKPSILNYELGIRNYGCGKLGIGAETLDLIKQGMLKACSNGGTAFPFFNFTPKIACKTGTAETGKGDATHAWLTAFAPDSARGRLAQVALTAVVEEGGEGSRVTAFIVRDVLEYWLNER